MDSLQNQTQAQRIVRPGAKRRRPPTACVQCYRRKIKCGRESPACSRCVKTGHGQECVYRDTSQTHVLGRSPVPELSVTLEDTSRTLSIVSQTGVSPHSSQTEQATEPHRPRGMTHLRGKGTTTKFYGFSYHLNLYQQFRDLRPYIVQIKARHPAIDQLRDEIYSMVSRRPRKPALSVTEGWDYEEALRKQVPSRSLADTLLQTYMGRFESTHRVLHIPVFMVKYTDHWMQPQYTPAPYLAQLLLVMAAAASFHLEEPMETSSLSIRPLAIRWIETVEAWLISNSNEPPESWSMLTIYCLLVIAKRANYVQESAVWTATGILVKWAMAAGYHREAGPTVQLTSFHCEMRRRLWATILELDIQTSIERGMPPTIRKGDFKTHLVTNIDDVAIQEMAAVPSLGQPLATWTDMSFQSVLQRSVGVRLEICALVNGSWEEVAFDEILRLSNELTQALRDIPAWDDPHASLQQQQTTSYVKTLLRLRLQENLLILYNPWAIQTPPTSETEIARRARLDAASAIVSYYKRLVNKNIITESSCHGGLVLAALCICHDIYLKYEHPESIQAVSTIPELSDFFLSMVERAMELIGKRVIIQVQGLNEYYVVCMAISLVKSKMWPESYFRSADEAAERVIRVSTLVRSSALASDSPRHSHAELNLVEAPSFQVAGEDNNFFSTLFSDDLGLLNQEFDLDLFHF